MSHVFTYGSLSLKLGPGRSLYVEREGGGPDVVLIHGAMTTSQDWLTSPVFEALTRSHRVSVVDRPGHGLSRRPCVRPHVTRPKRGRERYDTNLMTLIPFTQLAAVKLWL